MSDFDLLFNVGGMVEFRRSLAASFLFRFYAEVSGMLEKDSPSYKAADNLPPEYESAVRKFVRPAPKGVQYFTKVGDGQVVGAPERHMAADLQVSSLTDLIPIMHPIV